MSAVQPIFTGTITSGSSETVYVADNPANKRDRIFNHTHIQIDATGAGSLAIETKVYGQSAFNSQTTITGETVILDMVGVIELKLTASGADVPTSVLPYIASRPQSI